MALSRARWAVSALTAFGALLAADAAQAQQTAFHLDRLEVPGAPEDGLVLFRPQTHEQSILYAQLGLGLAIDPLRTANITNDAATLRRSPANVITSQFSTYLSAGFELFDR